MAVSEESLQEMESRPRWREPFSTRIASLRRLLNT